MDKLIHFDLSGRKAQLAVRFFTYGVMTVAVVGLTTLAVMFAMGYRFDKTRGFEQGGLIQFISNPDSASVYVDNQKLDYKTPGRGTFDAGAHKVSMQLDGYKAWEKNVDLAAGQLLWLNYARLLPTTIKTAAVQSLENAVVSLQSPDHKWMLVQTHAGSAEFSLVDMNDPTKTKVTKVTIPDAQLAKKDGKLGQFQFVEWDTGSKHVLVVHTNGDVREFIRFSRSDPDKSINLSNLFRLSIADAHFSGGNADVIYAKTDDVLRKLDISASSASAALVSGVEKFGLYDGATLSYVATDSSDGAPKKVVGIYDEGKAHVVRSYPADVDLQIAYSEYDHHSYLAINAGDGKVDLLRDPTGNSSGVSQFATFNFNKNVAWMKFNVSGRMIAVGNGSDFGTYDIELAKFNEAKFSVDVKSPLQWLDDYYLWSDAGNVLHIVEFDGTNGGDIAKVETGHAINLSADGKKMFSFVRPAGSGSISLQASDMVVKK